MSIRSWAESALALSLESIGDDVTIFSPGGGSQTLSGQVIRVDSMVDPQSGVRVFAPHTAVTLRLSKLHPVPQEGWRIATTDISGDPIIGVVRDLTFDHTMGMLTVMIEKEEQPVVTFGGVPVTFGEEVVVYAGN